MLEYVQDGCFSFQFYIKPQLAITILALACRCFSFQFYIKPQQTAFSVRFQHGCFSFQFYIKPQHHRRCRCSAEGCFSFQFYIKPQHLARGSSIRIVVSHSNSTSKITAPGNQLYTKLCNKYVANFTSLMRKENQQIQLMLILCYPVI